MSRSVELDMKVPLEFKLAEYIVAEYRGCGNTSFLNMHIELLYVPCVSCRDTSAVAERQPLQMDSERRKPLVSPKSSLSSGVSGGLCEHR